MLTTIFFNFSVRADDNHLSRDVLPSPPRVHKETETDMHKGIGTGKYEFRKGYF